MATHSDDMQSKEQPVPSVMVRGLSFQYRLLDEDAKNQPSSAQSQPAAIEDISFTLQKGELLLIAGPSGCGKSTLLKCLNGLIPHSYHGALTGEIYLNGHNIAGLSLRDLAQIVGTMLQDPDKQIIGSTVELEIAFGLENLNTPRSEMRRQVQAVAHRLHLESILKRETFALSGGQRQQVAAASLLVMHPSIYLFDEPFANLDTHAIDELERLIASLRAEGHTIILVEHRVEEALHLHPNKVMLMQDGRQVFFGDVQTFMQYADPTQIKLPVEATLRTLSNPAQARELLVRPIITGQQQTKSTPETILAFEHVSYRYGMFADEVLHDISFTIQRGETVALLGPNGAGKTTLVKQALGLLRPTKGNVLLYNEDTRKLSVAQLAARIGYVFQSPNAMLFAPTVRKELSFGPENLKFSPERLDAAVRAAEEALNLAALEARSPFSLSFGQQKRVTIASILAMQSRILLLDEPTAGQDYRSYISFMEYLRGLPELDALLFITHDLDLALRYTQRVLLLKEGQLVADGPPLQVLADTALLEACNLRPTSLLRYLLTEHSAIA